MIRVVIALMLAMTGIMPVHAMERFSYCGEMMLVEAPPMPMMSGPLYFGPTGVTPYPPKSCAYITPGAPRDGKYQPTIVVWSDVPPPMAYHADIFSTPDSIWGHRQQSPTANDLPRIREMERYLDAAAGSPVLKAALAAMVAGKKETTFERTLSVPMPFGGGQGMPMKVRYHLHDFRQDAPFPPHIQQLMQEAARHPFSHSPEWRPIVIPANHAR